MHNPASSNLPLSYHDNLYLSTKKSSKRKISAQLLPILPPRFSPEERFLLIESKVLAGGEVLID